MAPDTMLTEYTDVLDSVAHAAIELNTYELIRNLGRVLGIQPGQQVLLIAKGDTLQHVLNEEFSCKVTLFDGDMRQLPYADGTFDSVVVARPITTALHPVACELSRVINLQGMLGMIVLSMHADFVTEAGDNAERVRPFGSILRPAAAYRAVLAESGFTAFVNTPRKGDLMRNARENYQQYLLQPATPTPQPAPNATSQALMLLATNGVAVTLITAEKAL